ncbi:MAG: flippase-like domain-containing protein [Acidobacteria bacterium]|nr:flippase-like domain-containing protein [Acidobacteriota bacterium]
MSSSPAPRRFPWHAVLIAALTVGLVTLFLRSINLKEAWHATLGSDVRWIAGGVVVTFQTYALRAWRWQVLLQPIGRASFRQAFRATVVGFAASFLMPARVGEVLRPYLLARREGFDPTAAFATVIVERLLDLSTVMLLFGLAIVSSGVEIGPETRAAGLVAAVVSVVGLGVLSVLAGHPERLGRWAGRLTAWLPGRAGHVIATIVRTFTEGLQVMRSPGHLTLALLWSLPLWLSIALGMACVTWAFGLSMPFVGSFLVVGYVAVGVAAPTPGAAGGFHAMYLLALTQFFHAPADAAGAAAIVLHLVSFVPVTLLGLVYMWQDGLTFGGLKQMKTVAERETGAEGPGTPEIPR